MTGPRMSAAIGLGTGTGAETTDMAHPGMTAEADGQMTDMPADTTQVVGTGDAQAAILAAARSANGRSKKRWEVNLFMSYSV